MSKSKFPGVCPGGGMSRFRFDSRIMCTQFNIFLALPPSVPPRNYDILTDRHKSKSRQYIDRRERLGRVNSGETFMSRLGVLPSAAINCEEEGYYIIKAISSSKYCNNCNCHCQMLKRGRRVEKTVQPSSGQSFQIFFKIM